MTSFNLEPRRFVMTCWLTCSPTVCRGYENTPLADPLIGKIRLFGLHLRLVRAGECRVGHDPTAHGCLAALKASTLASV